MKGIALKADFAASSNIKAKVVSALKYLFVADSLSMPVHWFYRVSDIYSLYPNGITNLEDAPSYHPGSIMSLHSIKGGGRRERRHARKAPQIVGEVILKGKERYWNQPNVHYHHGMRAGENTLNAHCARLLMRSIRSNNGNYDRTAFLQAYIDFMTSECPLHPDTYAESYHREFFANLASGIPPEKCGGKTHDTASIGGLVTIGPLALSQLLSGLGLSEVQATCAEHLQLTHPDESLQKVSDSYIALLKGLLFMTSTADLEALIESIALSTNQESIKGLVDRQVPDGMVVGRKFSSACYITDSWPSILYLALKYHENPKSALLVNANLGGDNVHRGAILGIILGLANPTAVVPFFSELTESQALTNEIEALCGLSNA